jgi:hypothetical protein
MQEHENYPWVKIDELLYYIPEPVKALKRGFFKTEDTNKVFKVTGYHKRIQPLCLKFEAVDKKPLATMPLAKRVKPKKEHSLMVD